MTSRYRFSTDLFADEQHAGKLAARPGAETMREWFSNVAEAHTGEFRGEVRMGRVLALRQALKSGSYTVNAEDLAVCLMASMLGRE